MSASFKPTHRITVHFANGDIGHTPVMLDGNAAPSHIEWASTAKSSTRAPAWSCSDEGVWSYRGKPAPEGATLVTIVDERLAKATKAIESAVEYANGRDSEWGERAETAFGFLRDYLAEVAR